MEMQMTTEQRLLKLEQSNKRLKVGLLAIATVALGGVILGAAAPEPSVISAHRFVLTDDSGKERAELSANKQASALQFLNADGSRGVTIANGVSGNAVFVTGTDGKDHASLFASPDGSTTFAITKPGSEQDSFILKDTPQATALVFRDGNGKDRVNLGYTDKGASVLVEDANETPRGVIGEQGMVTYKKGGELEWSSLGENLSPEERKRVMDLINSSLLPQ